jgi:UDP-N-acetylmuramoyl-tripeptide--D-alanyl-D-alanine ligase
MDIRYLYSAFQKSGLVSTDSRNIRSGCLFFALKGDNFNGNLFALQAIESGASLAVVDEDTGQRHSQIIRVDHVLATLQELAQHHRRQLSLPLIAITGSNGKTTTKELCKAVLAKKFRVQATEGNLNNHIGVPLTLLSIDPLTDVGIIEMGANHPGEISLLCDIAEPDFGLITNIGKAHLEGFGSLEGVARAKGELFEHLRHRGKTIFVNEKDPLVAKLVPKSYARVSYYNGPRGIAEKHAHADPFLSLETAGGAESLKISTNLLGRYNIENVLAACCVGIKFGVPVKDIEEAIHNYKPGNNRSQYIETGKNRLFMDAYNANPSSMHAAISEFLQTREEKKVLILGEMREVGTSSRHEHEKLLEWLAGKELTEIICVGRSFEGMMPKTGFRYFETADKLSGYLLQNPVQDCFILIKGSRSNRLEKIVPFL